MSPAVVRPCGVFGLLGMRVHVVHLPDIDFVALGGHEVLCDTH